MDRILHAKSYAILICNIYRPDPYMILIWSIYGPYMTIYDHIWPIYGHVWTLLPDLALVSHSPVLKKRHRGPLPIGKSSKNIKIKYFPLNMEITYIVRIYILTMATLFWSIFYGKPCVKTPVMGWPW